MKTKQGYVGPIGFPLCQSMVLCRLRIFYWFMREMHPSAFMVASLFESSIGSYGANGSLVPSAFIGFASPKIPLLVAPYFVVPSTLAKGHQSNKGLCDH